MNQNPISSRIPTLRTCYSAPINVGQAFQPAGSPDFPVRPPGGWKVAPTGRQECLPHASSFAIPLVNFGIQVHRCSPRMRPAMGCIWRTVFLAVVTVGILQSRAPASGLAQDAAQRHHQRGVEFHVKRCLDEASQEYAAAWKLDPPAVKPQASGPLWLGASSRGSSLRLLNLSACWISR